MAWDKFRDAETPAWAFAHRSAPQLTITRVCVLSGCYLVLTRWLSEQLAQLFSPTPIYQLPQNSTPPCRIIGWMLDPDFTTLDRPTKKEEGSRLDRRSFVHRTIHWARGKPKKEARASGKHNYPCFLHM